MTPRSSSAPMQATRLALRAAVSAVAPLLLPSVAAALSAATRQTAIAVRVLDGLGARVCRCLPHLVLPYRHWCRRHLSFPPLAYLWRASGRGIPAMHDDWRQARYSARQRLCYTRGGLLYLAGVFCGRRRALLFGLSHATSCVSASVIHRRRCGSAAAGVGRLRLARNLRACRSSYGGALRARRRTCDNVAAGGGTTEGAARTLLA